MDVGTNTQVQLILSPRALLPLTQYNLVGQVNALDKVYLGLNLWVNNEVMDFERAMTNGDLLKQTAIKCVLEESSKLNQTNETQEDFNRVR